MVLLITFISVLGSLLFTPFLVLLLGVIFLASIGKSLGVRKAYIKILLLLFEYGRANIETAQRKTRHGYAGDEDLENKANQPDPPDETSSKAEEEQPPSLTEALLNGLLTPLPTNANGILPDSTLNGNHLLDREDKVKLVTEPTKHDGVESSGPSSDDETKSQDGKKYKDFELSNCFDWIKAGMEAIVEDEVTSCFETEELKNWNILTRTNRRYEFVSWRLTVIWMCGFFFRYCFLLPLRVLICFIGIWWMMSTTPIVGAFPDSAIKRFLNRFSYMMSFRIMARSLSGLIHIYNPEYRPANGSVCVANHTSPVDCLILSTDNTYSLVMWLTACTAAVGYIPEGDLKIKVNRYVSAMCFGILSSALSTVIKYHNQENVPRHGICVANHTSPIDALVLMCDNCYSLIGQRHGGFLGVLQRALARASPHIWFERSEAKDRTAVARKLKEHVSNPKNPPILIFPEGTCINNTSVMQFKKGSFEVGSVIYPVAIKYDPRFGDAFWNSSKYSMLQYLYMMMTSWAIVCEVWYLPPMYQRDGETAIDFANRVKGVIAKRGGLVDLVWDGQLKRSKPKKEWLEMQQEEFSKRLKCE